MPSKIPSTIPNNPVTRAQVRKDFKAQRDVRMMSPSKGPGAFGLGIAKVIRVDYVDHEVTLQILTGEDDLYQRSPIPISYAGAGPRHFFGAIPTVGSYCVVGYFSTTPKQPVILSWIVPGTLAGQDWLPVQDFLPTEVDFNTKRQTEFEGILQRERHKLLNVRPGMIVASSSQGSDLILDEGVILQNRRANELRLREQDQALVVRTLQQFHAMGGARIYAGLVQRDATLLPSQVVSDGFYWDAPKQTVAGVPIPGPLLGEDPTRPKGLLLPHPIFFKSDLTSPFPDSGVLYDSNVDPYDLLSRGLFIGPDGYVLNENQTLSAAEYGGKRYFRVSSDGENSAIGTDTTSSDTFTEWRLELDHTSDGRLPVTEQTDGFDADRLPSNSADDANALAHNLPYITIAYGSVVGNDPFSESGRNQYGLPLQAVIFDSFSRGPRLEGALGAPIGSHAATLLHIRNPLDPKALPSFVSFTKDGRFKGFIAGGPSQNSVEILAQGTIRVESGETIQLKGKNLVLDFEAGDSLNNNAFVVQARTGAIKLSAGGPTTQGSFSARANPDDLEESALPALTLESPSGNTHLTSARTTKITGSNEIQITETQQVSVVSKGSISFFSEKILENATTVDRTVLGKETNLYSGPKNFLPTNAPLRSTTFAGTPLTGHIGGDTDVYKIIFGNRSETFSLGSHTTNVIVGNLTYRTGVGTHTIQAGLNSVKVGSVEGMSALVPTGNINMQTSLSLSMKSITSSSLGSVGPTTVNGSTVTLGAAGKIGGIICAADLDPLTNLPLQTFGMGSPGHFLGPLVP